MDPVLKERYLEHMREGISEIEKGIHGLIMNDCTDIGALENIRRLNNVIEFMVSRLDANANAKPQELPEVDWSDADQW